jgi:ribosomal protein L29
MSSRTRLKEAQDLATQVIDDKEYVQELRARAKNGELPPALETMLWHYRFGKPVDKIVVTEEDDLAAMSSDELVKHLEELRRMAAALNPPDPSVTDDTSSGRIH